MADGSRVSAAGGLTTPAAAVIETSLGKVRGVSRAGILTFKGIPYGAAERFLAPEAAKAWTGERSALAYGPVCPQIERAGWKHDEVAFLFDWDDGFPGEDCLRLNVWTPGGQGKRPVMFFIHGGGYEAGSSQELPAYDGENLARRGDVVVISVNHRLGPFGYLKLEGGAANPGMLDIVLALEWVKENAAAFGGDAGNVTVFGQSGGGAKINTLTAMPAATGLFHKMIVQSGSQLRIASPERADEVRAALLDAAGCDEAGLRALSARALVEAGAQASAALRKAVRPNGAVWEGMVWQPFVDGVEVARHPYHPAPTATSHDIPLLVGGTLHESSPSMGVPKMEAIGWDQVRRDPQVIAAWRAVYPEALPVEIAAVINSASMGRLQPVAQARLKAAAGGAPAYLYQFAWKTPVLDGRPRAFHCSDLAFCLDNIDRCLNHTGGGDEARALAATMADAWIAFARTGNPGWAPVTAESLPTMVFDKECRVLDDHDAAGRAAMEA
ncbi:MAG: carboxylesterase family protein [Caulobacteraceae bacterium]